MKTDPYYELEKLSEKINDKWSAYNSIEEDYNSIINWAKDLNISLKDIPEEIGDLEYLKRSMNSQLYEINDDYDVFMKDLKSLDWFGRYDETTIYIKHKELMKKAKKGAKEYEKQLYEDEKSAGLTTANFQDWKNEKEKLKRQKQAETNKKKQQETNKKKQSSVTKSKNSYESKNTGERKKQRQDNINKQKQQELDKEYGNIFDEAINQDNERKKKEQQKIEQNQKNFENNQKKYANDPEYKYRQQRAKYNVDNISEQFENPEDLLDHFKKQRSNNKTNFSEKDYYDVKEYVEFHKDDIKFKNSKNDTAKKAAKEAAEEAAEENLEKSSMKRIFNKRTFGIVANSYFAISDYKDAREEGKGVIGAGLKSAGLFVAGEALGWAIAPIMLAKSAPSMAVSAIEGMQRMTREMNSMSRLQTFGDAQFQDTQQLATMRQAGMELAKMSQYNLQQSIMGNEAQSMHRL